MKKIIRIIKEDGIFGLLKRTIKKIKKNMNYVKRDKIYLKNIIKNSSYKKIIVFENNFGWSRIMKQRPQQMAENFDKDILFFYGTPYDEFDNNNRIDKIKDNLYLIDLKIYRKLIIKLLKNNQEKYLMIYSTDFVEQYIINKYLEDKFFVIYEYVDSIDKDLCNQQYYELLLNRRKEIANSNYSIITCTATKLYNDIININSSALVSIISNGVDYSHFHTGKTNRINEMERLKKKYKYIIGYYGALASWFDYELVSKVAEDKSILVALIGIDFDETLENSHILDIDNVKYFGKKDYNELIDYANYFDICIIPFKINDITKSTNPVKLFEYMALNKPIVTTNLLECSKYKGVLVSKNHNEFIKNIELAKNKINDKKYINILNEQAKDNDWRIKCRKLISFVDDCRPNLLPQKSKNIIIKFIIKCFKYLRWHLFDKNKIKIKTFLKKHFDVRVRDEYTKQIKKILQENNKIDRIIIWDSHYFGWNVGLFQRPQHIAMNMSKNNVLYFYDASNDYDKVKTIKKQMENLYLINTSNELFFNILLKEIKKIKKPKYLHIYSTEMALNLKQMLKIKKMGFNILYEYIDDLSPQISGTKQLPKNILDKYNYCLKDISDTAVVVTADNLENDVLKFRKKDQYVYSCNGVEYEHFQVKKDSSLTNDRMKDILKEKKPIIGYYGALASWFDYEMIKYLAKKRPNYNIVLIGVKYDDYYDKHNLEEFSNIHYLGTIDYKDLPYYAIYFDVCTIPFLINDITQATSPLKLFEYMALKKPIVTTAMHECLKYKSVFIAHDNEEYVNLIDTCLHMTEKNSKDYFQILNNEALDNTWSKKAKLILDFLEKFEDK